MKSLIAIVILVLSFDSALASDPIEWPKEKSVNWTTRFLSNVRIPNIEFTKESTVQDALDFLEVCYVEPHPFAINGNALGETILLSSIEYTENNVSPIEVLSVLADRFGADILIGRGMVTFRPRIDRAQQAGDGQARSRSESVDSTDSKP